MCRECDLLKGDALANMVELPAGQYLLINDDHPPRVHAELHLEESVERQALADEVGAVIDGDDYLSGLDVSDGADPLESRLTISRNRAGAFDGQYAVVRWAPDGSSAHQVGTIWTRSTHWSAVR